MFDVLIREAGARFGLGDKALPLVQMLLAYMTAKESGGLAGFLEKFKAAGFGPIIQSWLGGGPSAQPIGNTQYQTAEHTAQARLAGARARQQAADLKMSKTGVLAPDDGVISARSATVGSLTQPGQELFRLIRGGRLEWRAEVPSADLAKVSAGAVAILTAPGGETVRGKVRTVSPSVDPQTRNGLVYVDLPASKGIRAGMFARGEFELARSSALTLPQTAVVQREGFAYVFRMEGEDRVAQTKVNLGRRVGEQVEIVSGLAPAARVVAAGAGFLADGDVVKVVDGISK